MSDPTTRAPSQRSARKPAANTPAARPKLNLQELNPYFGGACLLAAAGAWITTAYAAAAALAIIGASFLLYWRDLRPWEQIPRWKRITVTTMIFIGGAFLVLYVISLGGF